ncbi:beta-ketoacyl-ACP synthase III [Qipengyuania flava]|uniref:beta-ketoacyl-ACP synthase III n=1 Tax=Qipengyuania flava TaxID=192812 RepID=UPI001C59ED63|nr:beta-ketoacyl-ACP synthase III [Qipengyuania flava]MBW3167913.1 beta-ketoacyl-ACP synthase III [Qipengyuania flava]MBY5965151.1 beta-ketoacyl-ACP synthase III [Qipengyuania flava]MBY6011475.1 beta-ketoacyl-ACP synthase III [Qipengyuania flava]MBY6025917.1 beta-ketoacyl-ACP synthase III [Qipengyuania flava]
MSHNKTLAGRPVISSTGLFTPAETITNEELVDSFNRYVERFNAENADAIAAGDTAALQPSSVEFIEKASGIKARHVMAKEPILDPGTMEPRLPERSNEELSFMAEIGVKAARQALEQAGRDVADVDAVLCAASNMERPYPAMAIEIQQELGIEGFAFDMNVACSSATFGIQTAADYIRSGNAKSVLVVSPEITSGHLNWRDRDSHFIFGDVATAVLVEDAAIAPDTHWDILGTRLKTVFSNNIRNNFGFLNRASPEGEGKADKLFVQEGRKVFKEVVPMVAEMIVTEAERLDIDPQALRRMWLHQANAGMNRLIAQKVLGHEASADESPTVLDTYANTSSAGSIIAFHKHNRDLADGDTGLICSFGAGYSAGAVFVRKVA